MERLFSFCLRCDGFWQDKLYCCQEEEEHTHGHEQWCEQVQERKREQELVQWREDFWAEGGRGQEKIKV